MGWFKTNKQRLAGVCRGLISIEPDERERQQANARAGDLTKVFGVTVETTSTLDEVQALARRLLADAIPTTTTASVQPMWP
ncbi:hypothetical protein NUKP99_37630 [Klebsiella variicola]|nr:hypothetical protein NUKP99_37630 [Klebsiella variicola]